MPLLFRRRTVLMPTLLGCAVLAVLASIPVLGWWFYGERFLATTTRVDADVLVVEAWLQQDGAQAVMAECSRPGAKYRYIVAAGGLTGERWSRKRWDETEIVEENLDRARLSNASFIRAHAPDVETHRTYAAAVAARDAIAALAIHPRGVNVVTRGSHARRSWITYQKVFGPGIPVGIVAWQPPAYGDEPWWRSSDRAIDFLKETVGYPYEAIFNSGRGASPRSIFSQHAVSYRLPPRPVHRRCDIPSGDTECIVATGRRNGSTGG